MRRWCANELGAQLSTSAGLLPIQAKEVKLASARGSKVRQQTTISFTIGRRPAQSHGRTRCQVIYARRDQLQAGSPWNPESGYSPCRWNDARSPLRRDANQAGSASGISRARRPGTRLALTLPIGLSISSPSPVPAPEWNTLLRTTTCSPQVHPFFRSHRVATPHAP